MNKNIAPDVFRQRLLLEGFWNVEVTKELIDSYLRSLADNLELRIYSEPIIYSPGGDGKEENQGFDAFVPLIDSGISAYFWSNKKFFSIVIYTCKGFDEVKAEAFTHKYLKVTGESYKRSF